MTVKEMREFIKDKADDDIIIIDPMYTLKIKAAAVTATEVAEAK